MFHIILYQPEIPPNTGNIIRLCANTGAQLHLIHPLGFALEDKQLRRAGLDYRECADIKEYSNLNECLSKNKFNHIYACSTKGKQTYYNAKFKVNDAFIFGPETRGLPKEVLNDFDKKTILRIPMMANSRSLNLSNSAAVVLYEALRQNDFSG